MSVSLFKREIRVIVDTLDITGLDVKAVIKSNLRPEPNTCDLQIINLNRDHRSQLEQKKSAVVQIEAGYENATSVLFVGNLRTSLSVEEGPDIITSLNSGDGERAIRSARINVSIHKDTKTIDVLQTIVRALGIEEGNLNDAVTLLQTSGIADIFSEGTVISGSASREMTNICRTAGLSWSVQKGKLQLLPLRTALAGLAIKLSGKTGLIDKPTVDTNGVLTARTLMIPDLIPGRKIVLESERLSGQYRVEECTYSLDTAGSDWYIELTGKRY
jgi:hypothetical protein